MPSPRKICPPRLRRSAVLAVLIAPLIVGCGKSNDQAATPEEPPKQSSATGTPAKADKPAADTPTPPNAATATAAAGKQESDSASTPAEAPAAKPAPPVIEDVVRKPATAAEAIATVDLRKLPIPADVEDPSIGPTDVGFQTKQPIKATFDAVEKFLLDAGCKPYYDRQSYPGSISGGYTKNGFRFNVSASSFEAEGKEPSTSIFVRNLGNVNLAKLPSPDCAKVWHAFPDTAAFITDAGVEETRKAMHDKLLAEGWQPYGVVADTRNYKQNATQISVNISSPPATPGQTVITFGSEQMGADLPVPATATRVDYSDTPTQVYVELPGTVDDVIKFHQETYTAAGWKATTERPIEDGNQRTLIFRNDAKDMLTLEVRQPNEGDGLSYMLQHKTGEEVAKDDERFKKYMAEKKKKEEQEKNAPKPKATIAVPTEATEVEAEETSIEFKVAAGTASDAVSAIIKALEGDGWKAEKPVGDKSVGEVTLKKDDHPVTIVHADPGFIPAEITVSGLGVQLEKADK